MKLRCAVIDDDPDWVDLILHCLAKTHVAFETIPFFDAATALRYLQGARVDLVITDLQMPKIDGFAFVEELRLFDKTTPVILVSSDQSAANEALVRGASAFVRKGALNSALARTAEELVAAHNHRNATLS